MDDRAAFQALVAQLDHHWAGAALEADLGDATMLFSQVGQGAGLVDAKPQRLLDIEVEALREAPGPEATVAFSSGEQ